jgi:hypothetical protein
VWWYIKLEGEKLKFDERRTTDMYKRSLKILESITFEHIGKPMMTSKAEQKFGLKVDKGHLWARLVYISAECGAND